MPKSVRIDRCIKCGTKGSFASGIWTERAEVAGVEFEAEVVTGCCPNPDCGAIRDPGNDELELVEVAIAASLARYGRCVPDAFKYMRLALDLRAVDLGELLAVAADTVSRWERGTVPLDRRAFAVLGQMVVEAYEGRSEMRDLLKAAQCPPSIPSPVRISVDPRTAHF